MRYFVSILVFQSSGWEKIAGCFALYVFLVPHDHCVVLPNGVMGLSAVCDCGIS